MINMGSAILFESEEDFLSNCQKDTSGHGFIIGDRKYPIEYPTHFPAVLRFVPNYDRHHTGSYKEETDKETKTIISEFLWAHNHKNGGF